jgi:hypothetical protein
VKPSPSWRLRSVVAVCCSRSMRGRPGGVSWFASPVAAVEVASV